MGRLELTLSPKNFHNHNCKRIQQGEVWVGFEPQGTILKSCICVGFHHAEKGIGAISHITGFRDDGGHHVHGALMELRKGLRRHGLEFSDCQCFLLGGAARARHVFDSIVQELQEQGIRYKALDILGNFHRKFVFEPAAGRITLYKKLQSEIADEAKKTYSSDRNYKCFHDPKRRLITGASLFFRNDLLLNAIGDVALPDLMKRAKRLHVWCAGCSNGMEAYSAGIIILDWLENRGLSSSGFKILGSDISAEALGTGQKGEYRVSEQGVRKNQTLFKKYTERIDAHNIRMGPELKSHITFKQRDIRIGSRRHLFELVICDHVMQYFSPEIQLEMLGPLANAVQPGGYAYISSPSPVIAEQIAQTYGFKILERHFYHKPRG